MNRRQRFVMFTLTLVCMAGLPSNAQNIRQLDSLKHSLLPQKIDTNQVNLLNKIAFIYSASDSANTFLYASQANDKAKALNFQRGIAKSLEAKANLFISKTNGAKALQLYNEAAKIWVAQKNDLLYAATLRNMGQAWYVMSRYDNALTELQKAANIFTKYKNTIGLSTVYQTTGNVYVGKGNSEIAIEYFLKALKLEEINKDLASIGSIQNNLGKLMLETKNYAEAEKYYGQSIQTSTFTGDVRLTAITQLNLGNVYITQGNYKKGREIIEAALKNFEKVGFKRGVQICINNLGAINLREGNYDTAIVYLKTSLTIAKENPAQVGVPLVQQNIGYGYLKLQQYNTALQWFEDAEATAEKFGADQFAFGEIYNHRSMLDSAMGNYKSALIYRTKYVDITDKNSGERVTKQVNELRTKYDVEKKELMIGLLSKTDSIKSLQLANQLVSINKNLYEISEQNLLLTAADLQLADDSLQLSIKNSTLLQNRLDSTQKEERIKDLNKQKQIQQLEVNRKNIAIVTISVFTVLLALLGYSFYKRRALQQQTVMQVALANQQQQATIKIIQAEEKERKRIAEDLHDGVGQLMTGAWLNLQALTRQIQPQNSQYELLNKTLLLVDESCKEVRQVSHNMMPNALLKKGLVNAVKEFIGQLNTGALTINVQTEELSKPLESHVETILYRVIQESVNNVVKHAAATHLDISLNQDADGIDVLIEDNGKGFDTTITRAADGIGLQNITSRINYLKGTVEWNSSLGKGTLVAIHIPPTA